MDEQGCPCWFCHKPIKDGEWRRMSSEFDCEVHETCLQNAINAPDYDIEAEILAREFGLPYDMYSKNAKLSDFPDKACYQEFLAEKEKRNG